MALGTDGVAMELPAGALTAGLELAGTAGAELELAGTAGAELELAPGTTSGVT